MNCISYSMVCKIFFCSKFLDVLEKTWQRSRKKRRQPIAKRHAFQANAISKFSHHHSKVAQVVKSNKGGRNVLMFF